MADFREQLSLTGINLPTVLNTSEADIIQDFSSRHYQIRFVMTVVWGFLVVHGFVWQRREWFASL